MKLKRYDPYRDWLNMGRSLSAFLEDFPRFGDLFDEDGVGTWTPAVDIVDEGNHFLVRAELPGVDPDKVDITVQEGILTLKGERETEKSEKKGNYLRQERTYGAFQRSFQLGQSVDAAQIRAKYRHGVLEIEIPKAKEAQVKKIAVEKV